MSNYGQYVVSNASEMVNLGVGQPRNEVLKRPLEYTKKYLSELSYDETSVMEPEVLQYGDIPGYYRFRKALSNYLNTKSYSSKPENFFQTNGVTEAVSLITLLLTRPTDLLVVEDPTYFLMINIFKELGRDVSKVNLLSSGPDLSELEKIIQENSHRTIMFYSIPFNHNPTGINYNDSTKTRIVELLDNYENFYMMTDEVYQLLDFESTKPPKPMAEYHTKIITMGSFSKVIAPAFRIGWIYSKNQEIIKTLNKSASRDSSGGNNVLNSLIVEKMLDNGDVNHLLKFEKERLQNNLYQINPIIKKLDKFFDCDIPIGGYFVWFQLREKYQYLKNQIFEQMENYKVKFHCGSKFSLNKNFDDCLRISLSFYQPDEIKLGLERLYSLMKDIYLSSNIFVNGNKGKLWSLISKEAKILDYIETKDLKDANLVIDETSPDGTIELLNQLMEMNLYPPVIVGTTGHKDFKIFVEYGKKGKIFYLSNFSNGIRKMKEIIKLVEDCTYQVSIKETHHLHMKD